MKLKCCQAGICSLCNQSFQVYLEMVEDYDLEERSFAFI